MFQLLFDKTPLKFEHVMIIKNFALYIGGIFTGFLLGLLVFVWFVKSTVRDKDLPAVEIMRIKRGSKDVIVTNPKKTGQIIHAIFIMIGWKLKLIKNNNIFYKDAKVSKIVCMIFIVILFSIVITSFSCMIDILDDGQ